MSTTPNPTAESVIAEAMVNAGAPLMHSRVEESVAAALRANGLLSEGAPSEEQVERAAKAYLNGGIYTLESDGEHHARMRAALTAAGVAPQENPKCEHGVELSDLCQFVDHVANAPQESSEEPAPSPAREFEESATVAASPKAVKDAPTDREKLIADLRNLAENSGAVTLRAEAVHDIADALAAQPVLDPEKVAKVVCDAIEDNESDEPYDTVAALALCEAFKKGELT